MYKKKLAIYLTCLSIILFLFLIVGIYFFKNHQPIKIDFLINDIFSSQLANENKIYFFEELNTLHAERIFGPESSIINTKGQILPGSTLGYVLLLGLIKKLGVQKFNLLNFVFFLILLIYSYKFSRLHWNNKSSLFFTLILSVFAPIIFFGNLMFNNLAALSLYSMALYYFFRGRMLLKRKYFLLFGIIAGIHAWVRYYDFIYYFPLVTLVNKNIIKKGVIFLLPFIVFIFSLLFASSLYYGAPWGFVGALNDGSISTPKEAYVTELGYLPGFFTDIETASKNLRIYVIHFVPPIFIFFILSIFSNYKRNKKSEIAGFVLFSFVLFSIFFCFLTVQGLTNNYSALDASYVRYLLPLYFYMLFTISPFLANHSSKFLKIIFIFFFIVFSFSLLFSDTGVKKIISRQDSFLEKKAYFESLPSNSIVLTKYDDLFIFPDNKVMYYHKLPEPDRLTKSSKIVYLLLESNYSVFFSHDDYWLQDPPEKYLSYYSENNLSVYEINKYLSEIRL